jgi:hypothetical protein
MKTLCVKRKTFWDIFVIRRWFDDRFEEGNEINGRKKENFTAKSFSKINFLFSWRWWWNNADFAPAFHGYEADSVRHSGHKIAVESGANNARRLAKACHEPHWKVWRNLNKQIEKFYSYNLKVFFWGIKNLSS